MSMDPEAALWTIALYAGEPDPLDLWEMDDGTQVDIGACVLALAGEMERLRKLHEHDLADAVRMADELAAECDNVDRARHGMMTARAERDAVQAEAERLRGERDRWVQRDDQQMLARLDHSERDAAQHEALRWAARYRIGQRHPGEAAVRNTAACLAAERGWDHLKFEADAPEGEQPRMPDPLEFDLAVMPRRAQLALRAAPDAEGEQPCPGCRGVGGSEECGDCEECKGRGTVGEQP